MHITPQANIPRGAYCAALNLKQVIMCMPPHIVGTLLKDSSGSKLTCRQGGYQHVCIYFLQAVCIRVVLVTHRTY